MANAITKILARKNQPAKKVEPVPVVDTTPAPTDSLAPCPACHSAIRWLNAAGQARCIGCQPPKFAALVRSREVLVQLPNSDECRWETLVAIPGGRLLSDTGIRELVARGELDSLTAASVGVGDRGGGAGGGRDALERFIEIDPDEYFES